MLHLLREIFVWLIDRKNLWMVPIVAILLLVSVLLLIASLGPLSPFLYPFF